MVQDSPRVVKKSYDGATVLVPEMVERTVNHVAMDQFRTSGVVHVAIAALRPALVHGLLDMKRVTT